MRMLVGGDGLGIGMGAAQLFENFVIVALDTQAHTVEALGFQPVQQPVRHGVRVGLKGDLRIGGYVKIPANGRQNDGQRVRAKIAWGAAAEIDGVHPVAGAKGPRLFQMGADGIQVAVHQLVILAGHGIEVAILALAAAEGNVNVDPQGGFVVASG